MESSVIRLNLKYIPAYYLKKGEGEGEGEKCQTRENQKVSAIVKIEFQKIEAEIGRMIDDSAGEAKLQLQQRRKKYDCTGRVQISHSSGELWR